MKKTILLGLLILSSEAVQAVTFFPGPPTPSDTLISIGNLNAATSGALTPDQQNHIVNGYIQDAIYLTTVTYIPPGNPAEYISDLIFDWTVPPESAVSSICAPYGPQYTCDPTVQPVPVSLEAYFGGASGAIYVGYQGQLGLYDGGIDATKVYLDGGTIVAGYNNAPLKWVQVMSDSTINVDAGGVLPIKFLRGTPGTILRKTGAGSITVPNVSERLPPKVITGNLVIVFGGSTAPNLCAGDLNGDGKIDISDYNIMAANFGNSNPTPAQGDLFGNGVVNAKDFWVLKQNFGVTCPQ